MEQSQHCCRKAPREETSSRTSSQFEGARQEEEVDLERGPGQSTRSNTDPPCAHHTTKRTALVVSLLFSIIGITVSASFLLIGLSSARGDQKLRFDKKAAQVVRGVSAAWKDYAGAALWIQETCRSTAKHVSVLAGTIPICAREDFTDLHEYLTVAQGLEFQAVGFLPFVNHTDRLAVEREAQRYYAAKYPSSPYFGFTGFEQEQGEDPLVFLRSNQEWYAPLQYVEPVPQNSAFLGFDANSIKSLVVELDYERFLQEWIPTVTSRLDLNQYFPPESKILDPGYHILYLHPGIPLSAHELSQPDSSSLVFLAISSLIKRSLDGQKGEDLDLFLFDVTLFKTKNTNGLVDPWQFLGSGSALTGEPIVNNLTLSQSERREPSLPDLKSSGRCYWETLPVTRKEWVVVVCHHSGYEPEILYLSVGASVIAVASLLLASWFYSSQMKAISTQIMRREAEAEKAALIVKSAEQATAQERELNEYLSHEVRNPLAAAMSACSFVSAALKEDRLNQESMTSCRNDVSIIDSSLKFINDLLRSMLDMHKASINRLQLEIRVTAVRQDVLETVHTVLESKHNQFAFEIDCPDDLVIETDPLRLKQIVMNLASNSRKFVSQGFLRIGARVKDSDGKVELFVEDSGPGIPQEKRTQLFAKYQESLDSLRQGTGMGLSLCKTLSKLLDGELYLDETYDSGIFGLPGTRFVLSLNQSPFEQNEDAENDLIPRKEKPEEVSVEATNDDDLPTNFSVLIVDDDMILRRMIQRSLTRVAPTWTFDQAANGETALKMTEKKAYDLAFVDQYMASAEKQLLGTETVHAMRAQGVKACLVGLSANQNEGPFINAGANAFIQKPFPCEEEALRNEILRVLRCERLEI
eukprot:scaffold18870_cov181-Amphora_coffeaeformis.AAC.2